uniref:Transglutaminase-like domain-containing protein n=1 Tax=Plectus sambesii TaxID=2011161 RepID=A0A914WEB6_9BILA
MVNGGNEQGILEGKWAAEEFTDGIAPSQWTGSAEILRAFDKFGLPVQYAQCWVFAGVVTTILRALGIPSRVVTNFCSAHDTDTSCTVDIHFLASTGKPIKELNKDSLWMFHVWNDCWMARPDLPEGYGGWQAVDATPQEKSDALYRAGPASLRAIREGQCSLPYDTSFVFAEVQAEKCYWLVDAKKHVRLNEVRKNEIGRMIITKRPRAEVESGADEIMDITSSYKQTEMPQEKREEIASTLLAGHSSVLRAHQAVQSAKSDVRFDLRLPHCTPMGQDLTATLSMLNESGSVRSVKVCLRLSAAAYTGEQGRKIASETCTVDIKPGERYSVVLLCSVRDYQEKLKGELATFVVSTVARVAETGQVFTAMDDLHLKLPDVEIEMLEQPLLNEPFKAVLKVANPLPITLTNCSFIVEGPGLLSANKIACSDIPSRGIARVPITVTPWKDGERTIIAHFRSKQLQDVNGSVTLFVPSHL